MNIKKWTVRPLHKERAAQLAEAEGLPFFLSMMLSIRGFESHDAIQALLMEEGSLSDPFLMTDMEKAASRIQRAIADFEKIVVYGDYDADGVTATAMLYSYLQTCGADVLFYIPDREGEGYGMNLSAVRALREQGVRLIITVDNGISSVEETALANSLGMDVVITDHHRPQSVLPEAVAVVDPHREDCTSPYREFSGAGVAFKLMMALEGEDGLPLLLENYADIATIGTIGDVVPLTGENRTLVKYGLRALAQTDKPGLDALMEHAAVKGKPATAGMVAFTLVPRINAVGRLHAPEKAVRLLLCEDPEEADDLAQEVCEDNQSRRDIESEIYKAALVQLQETPERFFDRVLVLDGADWHPGVIGIVASRIVDRFGKPCVVLSRGETLAKGSGRSIEGFSLFDAISSCSDLFLKFGGHPMAAGVSMLPENIPAFRERINAYAAKMDMPAQTLLIDCKLRPEALSVELPKMLQYLEPFGMGNPSPLFGLYGMRLEEITPVGGGKHLRLSLRKNGKRVTCMRFGVTPEAFPYSIGDTVDLAVTIDAQVFRGEETLSVVAREIRPSATEENQLLSQWRIYEAFRRGETLSQTEKQQLLPNRELFAALYRFLKSSAGWSGDAFLLYRRSGVQGFAKFLVALDTFAERQLITLTTDTVVFEIRLLPVSEKKDLFASKVLRNLEQLTMDGGNA